MSVNFLANDPLDDEIRRVLAAVADGRAGDGIESARVDLKQEAGRRTPAGLLAPGTPNNEEAARRLAAGCACMANTAGGGALIVGVADDGMPIGTELDAEWLRQRVYELLDRRLTVEVAAVQINGRFRLLVLRIPPAVEPIRYRGKIYWRVDDNCVEIDATSWHSRQFRVHGDWSAQASSHPPSDSRPSALERARAFLRASGEQQASDLAQATDLDLLRRLSALTPDGCLTNAASLVFIGRGESALDYIRREVPGGDSVLRLRTTGVSLVEELHDIDQAFQVGNRVRHQSVEGLAIGQIEAVPRRAVREAIVNGVAHRDWNSPDPTTVEHVGDTVTVTSVGGLPVGITPSNIITHPSLPRNRALTALLAKLRIAEREGIGVDRMVGDMIRYGHSPPIIEERTGPRVRVVLLGGLPDSDWLALLSHLVPESTVGSLDSLLLLRQVVQTGWVDAKSGSPLLQKSEQEALYALAVLSSVQYRGQPVIQPVTGVPSEAEPAWRPSDEVRRAVPAATLRVTGPAARPGVAVQWAQARGRISTTELADIAGTYPNYAGDILKNLQADGVLLPSRQGRGGRGYHYIPVGPAGPVGR
ncbi:MAG: RNA-binding domain-containing protein [Actinomycetes bacterium]